MRKVILCLVAVCAMTTFLFGQDIRTATLVGTVTDGSGAVLVNVAVNLTNVDTQVATRSLTNGEGAYYLPFLNVGNYRLRLEAPGFKRFEQSGLLLNAGATQRLDVKLEVGAVTDEIKVTGMAPLLETDSAVVGGITNAKEIHDTPIPQSKPQHFMYYQEGSQANN